MDKIVGLLRLLRPVNCSMMGLAVLIGELITYGTLSPLAPSILGFVTAFTLTGASMVANDYWDRYVDAVNAPKRPISSGLVSVKEALSYATLLVAIGLSTALMTNLTCFMIAIASLAISLFYNTKGKKMGLIGNFMVSACVAVPLLYGGFTHKGLNVNQEKLSLLLLFDLMVFLSNTGREINKGMADVEGDAIRGVKTIALSSGLKTAAKAAAVFYIIPVGLSVFPWLFNLSSEMYLPIVAVADVGFVSSSFILLHDYTKENARRVKNMVLLWMVIGLFAFIVGGKG